jgi:hypothetical protein
MEVNLAGQNTITVALVASGKQLDQVVVVGYGTQRKKDLTVQPSHTLHVGFLKDEEEILD